MPLFVSCQYGRERKLGHVLWDTHGLYIPTHRSVPWTVVDHRVRKKYRMNKLLNIQNTGGKNRRGEISNPTIKWLDFEHAGHWNFLAIHSDVQIIKINSKLLKIYILIASIMSNNHLNLKEKPVIVIKTKIEERKIFHPKWMYKCLEWRTYW